MTQIALNRTYCRRWVTIGSVRGRSTTTTNQYQHNGVNYACWQFQRAVPNPIVERAFRKLPPPLLLICNSLLQNTFLPLHNPEVGGSSPLIGIDNGPRVRAVVQ